MSWHTKNFTASLEWLNNPTDWRVVDEDGILEGSGGAYSISENGSELRLSPPAKKDFWSKTFYTPELKKSDASGLLATIPLDCESTIGVEFEFTAVSQFDQAGLLIYLDDEHWVKCGIEFCDNSPYLSVVVCNVFSDWSTQLWGGFGAKLRVHKVLQADSIMVEAAPLQSEDFHFVRIAHLSSTTLPGSPAWRIGPYAACPTAQKGCSAVFRHFEVSAKTDSGHSSSL